MSNTTTKPKATKEFKALVASLGSQELAATAWNALHPENPVKVKAKTEEPAEAAPLTSYEVSQALVAQAGFVPVRGRVYATPEIIEAQVRVLKTGKPEVVRTSGEHRTKAVVIYRTDDGTTVAVQNLGQPN